METPQPFSGTPIPPNELTRLHHAPSRVESRVAPPFSRLLAPIAALVVIALAFHLIAQPDLASVFGDLLVRLLTLLVVILAASLVAIFRYQLAGSSTLVALGFSFEILVAFWIALVETSVPVAIDRPVLGLSAVGPWVLLFGVLVPDRPRWTLIAGLTAATMWPLAYAINVARLDFTVAPWTRLVVWPGVNYVMVLLGWLLGRRFADVLVAPSAESSDELGKYHLLAPIGSGGMGEVWKAGHDMLARQAAIKLVRPMTRATSPKQMDLWVKRFRREANVIAGLQSPHTIYLYDFGVSRDGQFYYVMELLDGVSLQTLITNFGPQPPSRVRSMLMQVCESLEEAHQQSLVHRDLKPSNVMLCKVALQHDFVKVLDFGLAKCAACEDATQLTVEGVTAGTPGYIAPEVALGETKIDGRADLYALGCVAYFLLTGTMVFNDTNPMTVALKHVQAQPDPPSSRTELPIPIEMEQLIMRCLEKNPHDRPASAREISASLEAMDLPPWTEDDAAAWWDRNLPATSTLRTLPATVTDPRTLERV
ncbi:MAG: serine/threonine-protein kinase [Acidobacteriota bacterium]